MAYNPNPCMINTENSSLEAGVMLVRMNGRVMTCDHIEDGVNYTIDGCRFACYYPTEKQPSIYAAPECPPCEPCVGSCEDCEAETK